METILNRGSLGLMQQDSNFTQMLAPYLLAEGYDPQNPPDISLDEMNALMARAIERYNFDISHPTGRDRTQALEFLEDFTFAMAGGQTRTARTLMDSVGPERTETRPAASSVIGVGFELVDRWYTDPELRSALSGVRLPQWSKPARAAGTTILAQARQGGAASSDSALIKTHGGKVVLEGLTLVVSASLQKLSQRSGDSIAKVVGRMLADTQETSPVFGAFQRQRPEAPMNVIPFPGLAQQRPDRREQTLSEFEAWANIHLHLITAPDVEAETYVLEGLLDLAEAAGVSLLGPADVWPVAELIIDRAARTEPGAASMMLSVLGDYLAFQVQTSSAPSRWAQELEGLERYLDPGDSSLDLLVQRLRSESQPSAEAQREAHQATLLVQSITDVLRWIGDGVPATSTGAFQRKDIEHTASLLGIRAKGVAKVPSFDDPGFDPDVMYLRTMWELPLLGLWLETLESAELLGSSTTRLYPTAKGRAWAQAPVPPADAVQKVVSMFVALTLLSGSADEPHPAVEGGVQTAINYLKESIEAGTPLTFEDFPVSASYTRDEYVQHHARSTLDKLLRVGILDWDGESFMVPAVYRLPVAIGLNVAERTSSGLPLY